MVSARSTRIFRQALGLSAVLLLSAPSAFAEPCGLNTPAEPVAQFREGIEVWPVGLRPGRPGQILDPSRDSTDRFGGIGIPSAKRGHELFKSLDVLDDFLFSAYNVGLQAWLIDSAAASEDPIKLGYADGFDGHWLSFPPPNEQLNYVESISAGKSGEQYVLGVSGKSPVGPSIWLFDGITNLTQAYQDIGVAVRQVRLVESGGTLYMFGIVEDSSHGGVAVWNATAAAGLAAPCIDDQGSVCPGVFLGFLPDQVRGRYLDAISWNGSTYVTTGDQFVESELWRVDDPSVPASAQLLALGDSNVRGPAFVTKDDDLYLAYVNDDAIKFFDVTSCTDANGCPGGYGSPVKTEAVKGSTEEFLSFSTSADGTPYVYYGVSAFTLEGDQVEKLLDVSALGSSGPLVEVTATGGTYIDPCNGLPVDYWGDYYQNNDSGLNTMHPRIGKFSGDYFYRAAQSILDVHVKTNEVVSPTVTVTVDDNPAQPPYYLGDDIAFDAVAQGCDGPESWSWFSDDTDTAGLGPGGPQTTLNWALCGSSTCPDKVVQVWATKDACAGASDLVVQGESITVVDPRPVIQSIHVQPDAVSYPVCTLLTVSADVDGRDPIARSWEVRGPQGDLLATSNQPTFVWDTSNVDVTQLPALIFDAGFESGGLGEWSSVVGGRAEVPGLTRPTAPTPTKTIWDLFAATKTTQIDVDIHLAATNPDASVDATRTVTITQLGVLEIGSPAITSTALGDGEYRLRAETSNATEWRWIIEDPANGSTTNCDGLYSRCEVFEFGAASQTLDYQWATPNTDGTYGVYVEGRNCVDLVGVSGQITLPVTGIVNPTPPTVISFQIDLDNSPGCTSSLGFTDCESNRAIFFEVVSEDDPTHYEFDWEGDGVYEDVVPVGVTPTHSYSTVGPKVPRVRATRDGTTSNVVWLSGSLVILP